MSAEGPVRKPSSDPPDVDSLMSRLDGEGSETGDRSSDPGGERRPSAAELLGGRGRRTKRTIRVPDDAVPAGTPPAHAQRRSNPPPASQPIASQPIASQPIASQPIASQPVASQPVASQPVASQPVASQPVASQPGAPVSQPPQPIAPTLAQDLLQRPSLFDNDGRITPQRIISVGDPLAAPPPWSRPPPEPTAARPVSTPAPPPEPAPPVEPVSAPMPAYGPNSDVRIATAKEPRAPTIPNLDAQVREALALLDREDFETSIDISVAPEPEQGPPSNEEDLGDAEVEVVASPAPVGSSRVDLQACKLEYSIVSPK